MKMNIDGYNDRCENAKTFDAIEKISDLKKYDNVIMLSDNTMRIDGKYEFSLIERDNQVFVKDL